MDVDDYVLVVKTTSSDNEDEDYRVPMDMELQESTAEDLSKEEDWKRFVKEEIIIDEETSDASVENDKEKKEKDIIRLASAAIVFTTRLDDMQIFNQNIDHLTRKYILNSILKESTPKYNNQKPAKLPYSKESYRTVTQKIVKINNITKCENSYTNRKKAATSTDIVAEALLAHNACLRNEKLLKMCKPLSIVLERLENVGAQPKQKQQISQSSQNNMLESCCLVFQDNSLKETDIYCLKNGKIIENNSIKNIDDTAIVPYINAYKKAGFKVKKMYFCCWHQRENFINCSLNRSKFNANIKKFMTKPHYCVFDRCTCCCGPSNDKKEYDNITSVDISPEDIEIKDLEKEISDTLHGIKHNSVKNEYGYKNDWLENLVTEAKGSDTFVGKALNYTRPPLKPTEEVESKSTYNNIMSNHIMIIMRLDNGGKKEFYELQKEGGVVAYFNNTSTSIASKYQDPTSERNVDWSIFDVKTCCWYAREKKMSYLNSKSTSLKRYIQLPHLCLPGKCNCCCKAQKPTGPWINTVVQNRNIPKPTRQMIQNSTDAINSFISSDDEPSRSTETIKNNTTQQYTNKTSKPLSQVAKRRQNKLPSLETRQTPIKILPKPSPSQTMCNNIIPSTTNQLKKSTTGMPTKIIDSDQKLAVDSMITTVLNRFKDVRLTITEDGKVAASLNAPVDTLNTAELKVLANILAHAQKQVQVLGTQGLSVKSVPLPTHLYDQLKPTIESSQNKSLPDSQSNDSSQNPSLISDQSNNSLQNEKLKGSQSNVNSNMQTVQKNTIHPRKYHDNIPQPEILRSFSNMSQYNSNSLMQSYTSYIESMKNNITPKITNVFSLKDSKFGESLSKSVKSQKTDSAVASKRKSVDSEPQPPSKIRVVDPSKLGIPGFKSNLLENAITKGNHTSQSKVLNDNLNEIMSGPFEIIQSLPRISNVIGNEENPQTTSTITSNQNNILCTNTSTAPMNIQMLPQAASSTVFTISNLDTASIEEPRLLTTEPVILNFNVFTPPPAIISPVPDLVPVASPSTTNIKSINKKKPNMLRKTSR